jgi:hypothetical protein
MRKKSIFMNRFILDIICSFLFISTISISYSGCKEKNVLLEHKKDYHVSEENIKHTKNETLALVRSVLIEQQHSLSEKEKEIILQSSPRFAEYRMASVVGQYEWTWSLPTGRIASITFLGDLDAIDKEKLVTNLSNID